MEEAHLINKYEELYRKHNGIQELMYRDCPSWVNKRVENTISWISKNVENKSVLDIGCAEGMFTYEASAFGARRSVGIDFCRDSIIEARSRYRHLEFFIGSAVNLPFPDDTFDIVLMLEVLEHIDDVNKAVSEAFRVGNLIFCTVPYNEPSGLNELHLHVFDGEGIERLFDGHYNFHFNDGYYIYLEATR